jgi:hypothetical protein
MSNDDIEKKEPPLPAIVDDGFAGWEDGVAGDDRPQGAGVIQGTLIKFSNEDGSAAATRTPTVCCDSISRAEQP